MQVRLLKHWNGYRPGTILAKAGDGMANVLVKRGLAEPVEAERAPRRRTVSAKIDKVEPVDQSST